MSMGPNAGRSAGPLNSALRSLEHTPSKDSRISRVLLVLDQGERRDLCTSRITDHQFIC